MYRLVVFFTIVFVVVAMHGACCVRGNSATVREEDAVEI